jgi:hypothetical protein
MINCNLINQKETQIKNRSKIEQTLNEDIFLLETILQSFIPFFKDINEIILDDAYKLSKFIQDLTIQIGNNSGNGKNKKRKNTFNYDNVLKLEEKEFLYKTYISSSETNQGTFKFFSENSLKINNITDQLIRSLLILIKEELQLGTLNKTLIDKLFRVKKLIINENKPSDFKLLFILLNFIVLKFCPNLVEIKFEGTFNSRIDQIDLMLKNGVYLYFIYKSHKIRKLYLINKIEFLNENVAFKILHEYCIRNNITDFNPGEIEINKINIFSIMPLKLNLKSIILNKICIDKNSFITSIIETINSNKELTQLTLHKFVSIPEHFRDYLLGSIGNLRMLEKLKINIISSQKEDLQFLNLIQKYNLIKMKKFYLKLSRVCFEDEIFDFSISNLQKISLKFEKFTLTKFNCLFPKNLKEISMGLIDHTFLSGFTQFITSTNYSLDNIKFNFLHINDENYEEAYKNIIHLLESCKSVKSFHFENFVIKFKNIFDEELRNILRENIRLRKLIIRSEVPYHVQYFEGYYYHEYPKFTLNTMLYVFKENPLFQNKIYSKKRIITNILSFHKIKKEKIVVISYRI